MIRIITVFFILSLTMANANAKEKAAAGFFDDAFYGISLINQNIDLEQNGPGGTITDTDSGTGIGLYLDKYYKRKIRFNATLGLVGYDDFDVIEFVVSADYLFPINNKYTFFAGGSLGGALQKFSDASLSDAGLGAVYGVQFGFLAVVSKSIIVELGYRLRPTDVETELASIANTTITADDLSETYLSVLFLF